ncbi:hypothetical protein G9C98_008556, partial [Cotesia typhae]
MFANHLLKVKYMFFKIIGLAPFTFEDAEKLDECNLKTIKMKHSQLGNLYNSVLIVLIFILGAFVFKQLLHNDLPHTTKIIDLIYIIKAVVGVVVLLSLWIIMILYQPKAVKLINTMIENNKMINNNRNMCGVFSLSQFGYQITILNIINWCIWFGTLVTYPFAYEISLSTSIIVYLPAFISCCLLMQYVIMVELQKKKFFSLHAAFIKLTNRIGFSDERVITRIIIELKQIYEMFYSTTEEIARYYSLPVFLIIINSCGKIFFLTYNLLHPLIYENSPYKHAKSVTEIHLVFNLIMEGFPIVVLTYEVT